MGTESLRLTAGATSVDDLTDDLLELVLLGLSSPAYLVRASAACKRWYRLVAGTGGAAFLRRFRSLHPPRAIGTFYSIIPDPDQPRSYGENHLWPYVDPVFVPSSASASDEPSGGLQLSLDFVPPANHGRRELVDGRGSLLLLLGEKDRTDCPCCWMAADYMTPDLVVCEPLTRQYQAIPPPIRNVCVLGAFLLNGDADEACGAGATIGMTNFSVLLVQYEHDYRNGEANGHGHPLASMFTCCGGIGGWYYGENDEDGVYLPSLDEVHLAGRTGGRIYWGCEDKQVMVVDERTLEFSVMALAEHMMSWMEFGRDNFRVVGGGHAGTVRIINFTYDGELEVFGQLRGGGGNDDWVLEMSVRMEEASPGLPVEHEEEDYDLVTETRIIDTAEGLVVLLSPQMGAFSVDLEAKELKREDGRKEYTGPAFPYTLPWPPVMRACVDNMAPK
ncbi:unnamed protein product [Urochloa decumbens]|uniref:F-box domain-containing protein n=1 Tax=Urochloa decumbens TaxID=240449 RepID=A0ABC9G6E7_9POAL